MLDPSNWTEETRRYIYELMKQRGWKAEWAHKFIFDEFRKLSGVKDELEMCIELDTTANNLENAVVAFLKKQKRVVASSELSVEDLSSIKPGVLICKEDGEQRERIFQFLVSSSGKEYLQSKKLSVEERSIYGSGRCLVINAAE